MQWRRGWAFPAAPSRTSSAAHYDVPAPLRTEAISLGAIAISRHTDRALLKALIANARAQARGEVP